MKTIDVVIVEDEKHSREFLKNILKDHCREVNLLGEAASVNEALELIPQVKPDLIFMDVELRIGTGFDILSELSQLDFEVVFTTAFEHYALKAIKFSSIDYLLKPIAIPELRSAVHKTIEKKNDKLHKERLETLLYNIGQQDASLQKLCLSTTEGIEFINVYDIVYCEAQGAYTRFVLTSGSGLLVSKHLKEYEKLLKNHHFMRVHNSYLINLKEVKKYIKSDGGYIFMKNNDTVNISRSRKEEFLSRMNQL